ncbi:MAG: DUF1501 domain-containing protein [Planctomycetia bacterium]|nr:DUF1501 domain-containing protein [Planctomycetia bacterium]
MLDIAESRNLVPAGRSRRSFLRIGSLCVGGLTCADMLRIESASAKAIRPQQKSIIMVYLPGGASHIDMYDMKPEAPAEYRGEFRPIKTNVAGLDVCELLPLHAKIADKFSIIRGIKTRGNHDPTELLTGIPASASGQIGSLRRPAIGCVVSKLRGADGPIPPYVSVSSHRLLPSYDDPEEPAYLGPAHRPFNIAGEVRQDLELSKEIRDRFHGRRELLRSLDRVGRDLPDMTTYNDRALEMLTTTQVREALDLTQEKQSVREAYGEGFDPKSQGLDLLRARRLAEAGVSLVSVGARFFGKQFGTIFDNGWDTHAGNFGLLRNKLPIYDRAVAALINDLHERGLSERVAVVIWSEFGRSPKIGDVTPDGRGHWPSAMCALVAGGGLKMGQVIGETDHRGERARFLPFGTQDVLATIYHTLGIDLRETIVDHNGRPQYLVDNGTPIAGLI